MTPLRIIATIDETVILMSICSILNEMDSIELVGTANNASDTLKLVKEREPDLVLLDTKLHDMEGIELVEKLRNEKPNLYIVFITAQKKYLHEALRLYAYGYITKPIKKERVKDTIRCIQQAMQIPKISPANSVI